MKTSESISTIAPLLLQAQMQMADVKKGAENPYYNSSYADLNSVRAAAIPLLNSLGISVLQPTIVIEGKNYVETMLLHTSGEFVSSQTAIVNDKGTAQAEGSGLSYARRYGLQALLNIGAVDDDAEDATLRNGISTKKGQTTGTVTLSASSSVSSSSINGVKKSTFRKPATTTNELVDVHRLSESSYDAELLKGQTNGAFVQPSAEKEVAEEAWE